MEFPLTENIKKIAKFDKNESMYVVGRFDSRLTPPQIVKEFRTALLSDGWKIKSDATDPRVQLSLCRDGIAASIYPDTTSEGTRVSIYVSWTYYTETTGNCPW
ncbi:hypothetical protein [Luteibacter yeojuensis]